MTEGLRGTNRISGAPVLRHLYSFSVLSHSLDGSIRWSEKCDVTVDFILPTLGVNFPYVLPSVRPSRKGDITPAPTTPNAIVFLVDSLLHESDVFHQQIDQYY